MPGVDQRPAQAFGEPEAAGQMVGEVVLGGKGEHQQVACRHPGEVGVQDDAQVVGRIDQPRRRQQRPVAGQRRAAQGATGGRRRDQQGRPGLPAVGDCSYNFV